MKRENIIAITLICAFLLVGGCAVDSTKTVKSSTPEKPKTDSAQTSSETAQKSQNLPQLLKTDIPENLSESNNPPVSSAFGGGDTEQLLIRTWRYGWGPNAPNCGSEHIFMQDGSYSGMGGCAGFVPLRTVGKWFLNENGTLRIAYSDWEPKQDQAGNPIRIPSGETWSFRFLDRNRMALGDGAIIAYRVN